MTIDLDKLGQIDINLSVSITDDSIEKMDTLTFEPSDGYEIVSLLLTQDIVDSIININHVGGTYYFDRESTKITYSIDNTTLLENQRKSAIGRLRSEVDIKLESIDKDEDKAKTLFLEWIGNGSVGDKPEYWVLWKDARDIIVGKYDTCKAYILDESRTIEELTDWQWVD